MPLRFTARMNARGFVAEQKRLFAKIKRAERIGLMRGGGLVRQIAKRSIRAGGKKNVVSEPGEPIRWHVKPGVVGNIYFAFDERSSTVVVGPISFAGSDLPEKLEKGGIITISRLRHRNGQLIKEETRVRIRPRPTMKLALKVATPKLAEKFRDTIKT